VPPDAPPAPPPPPPPYALILSLCGGFLFLVLIALLASYCKQKNRLFAPKVRKKNLDISNFFTGGRGVSEKEDFADDLAINPVVQAKMMKVLMEKQGAHMAPTESSNGHAEESKPKPAAPTDETAAGNDMSNNLDYLARRRSSADRVSNELDQLINNTAIVVS
jgi:hypothetical protein